MNPPTTNPPWHTNKTYVLIAGTVAAVVLLFAGYTLAKIEQPTTNTETANPQSPQATNDGVEPAENPVTDQEAEQPSEPQVLNKQLLHEDSASSEFADIQMDGQPYEDALLVQHWSELRLDKKYSSFVATVGAEDNNSSSNESELVITDEADNVLYQQTFRLGDTETIEIDTTGILRLRFAHNYGGRGDVIAVSGQLVP